MVRGHSRGYQFVVARVGNLIFLSVNRTPANTIFSHKCFDLSIFLFLTLTKNNFVLNIFKRVTELNK